MTIYNKEFCFNCADLTDDYADVTPTYRVYICHKKDCRKALAEEVKLSRQKIDERSDDFPMGYEY
jgi:hypothetical protein